MYSIRMQCNEKLFANKTDWFLLLVLALLVPDYSKIWAIQPFHSELHYSYITVFLRIHQIADEQMGNFKMK